MIRNSELDNLYYNVIIPHKLSDNNAPSPALFTETRVQPLIDMPRDWYMSIVRLTVPVTNIPIFIFKSDTYRITLRYNNQVVQEYVKFLPRNRTVPITDISYYYVYDIQHMLDMVNIAFTTAFSNLTGRPQNMAQPFVIYDENTELLSVVAQRDYYDLGANTPPPSVADVVYIYINNYLYRFFQGLPVVNFSNNTDTLGLDKLVIVTDQQDNWYNPSFLPICQGYQGSWNASTNTPTLASGVGTSFYFYKVSVAGTTTLDGLNNWSIGDIAYFNNGIWSRYTDVGCIPPEYFIITQNFKSIPNWFDFQTLTITSSLLPIAYEFVPNLKVDANGSSLLSSGLVNYRPIITDFQPLFTSISDLSTLLQYIPNGQYRLVDLHGDNPLMQVDLQVWWVDKENVLHPVYLNVGEQVNIKILFARRELYKGSFNLLKV